MVFSDNISVLQNSHPQHVDVFPTGMSKMKLAGVGGEIQSTVLLLLPQWLHQGLSRRQSFIEVIQIPSFLNLHTFPILGMKDRYTSV